MELTEVVIGPHDLEGDRRAVTGLVAKVPSNSVDKFLHRDFEVLRG
jgi:hypothetical protein